MRKLLIYIGFCAAVLLFVSTTLIEFVITPKMTGVSAGEIVTKNGTSYQVGEIDHSGEIHYFRTISAQVHRTYVLLDGLDSVLGVLGVATFISAIGLVILQYYAAPAVVAGPLFGPPSAAGPPIVADKAAATNPNAWLFPILGSRQLVSADRESVITELRQAVERIRPHDPFRARAGFGYLVRSRVLRRSAFYVWPASSSIAAAVEIKRAPNGCLIKTVPVGRWWILAFSIVWALGIRACATGFLNRKFGWANSITALMMGLFATLVLLAFIGFWYFQARRLFDSLQVFIADCIKAARNTGK